MPVTAANPETQEGFLSVLLQPTHMDNRIRVSWQLPITWLNSEVFIYRSDTGVPPWELRNENAPVDALLGMYDDDAGEYKFIPGQPLNYRLAARRRSDGKILASGPVTVASNILGTRSMKIIRAILRNEEMGAHKTGNGQPAWLLFPKIAGTESQQFDSIGGDIATGDMASTYGEPRGFLPPIASRVILKATGRRNYAAPVADASGAEQDVSTRKARFLAHPRPRNGMVVVFPLSDDRYVVGDKINQFLFQGVYAIAHEAEVLLLPRNDLRYRIPIPTTAPQ